MEAGTQAPEGLFGFYSKVKMEHLLYALKGLLSNEYSP